MRQNVPAQAGQRVLQFFYLRVDDFDVAPAVFTNKMIVVGVGGVLIAGQPIAKPYLTGQPRPAQKLHGPVDGGLAKGRIFLADSVIDFFGRQVPAFIKEHFHDLLTLRRVTQPLVFQEGTKDLSGVAYWSVFTEHAPPRVGLQEWTIA